MIYYKETGESDKLRVVIDKANESDNQTFSEIKIAKEKLEKLKKFLRTYLITKANGFIWKGRDIDNLETEKLYTDSEFVLVFLYRSEFEDMEASEKKAYL